MKILLAKNSGFCFGVRRAVDMAESLANSEKPVYTYGHIIHNEMVVARLKEMRVFPAEDAETLSAGDTLIVRAHGAPPSLYDTCEARGIRLIDATCPFVMRIHRIVQSAAAEGRQVLIAGKPDHPEVVGIVSRAGDDAAVIATAEEAKRITAKPRAILVAQTTLPEGMYRDIQTALMEKCGELEVYDTICDTTRDRQREAIEIAKRCDRVLVLGSEMSANTGKLAALCGLYCKNTQTIGDIGKLFLDNLQSDDIIGVVAGASTPDWMIREVIQVMSELEKTTIETIEAEAPAEEIVMEQAPEAIEEAAAEAAVVAEVAETVTEAAEAVAVAVDEEACPPEAPKAEEPEPEAEAPKDEEPEAEEPKPEEPKAEEPKVEEPKVEEPKAEEPKAEEPKPEEPKAEESSDFAEAFEKTMTRIHNGQVIEGTVLSIVDGEVFVNVGYKSDGVIPKSEFSSDPDSKPEELFKEGDAIDVEVIKVNDGEGNVLLSRKNVESRKLWDDLMEQEGVEDKVFEATCKEVVKGGVIADIGGIRAFVPASQVSTKYIENLSEFIGKPMKLKVLEVDKQRKRIVASQKQVMLAEAAAAKREKWEALVSGSKVMGIVRRITDFGAFVDIGGIDGLVHVTDAAWGRVKHPSDVFEIGQEIEVLILNVDVDKERVSLGYKQLQPKPWTLADTKYPVGSIVEGKVVRIVPFGAFVALENTIDGLIHISQVATRRIAKVEDELKVGDMVRCKVLEVNPEAKRISLSRKEALIEEDPELAAKLQAEKEERDRQYAERQEQRSQQREQQQAQRASRSDAPRSSERGGDSGERRERSDRRRRNSEDGDYDLPPVQEATTSLASLFQGIKVDD